MGFARAILVALISISIAFLPVTGGASASSKSVEALSSDYADDYADMPCCPSCDTQADYKACALKCAALASAVLPAMTVAPLYVAEGSLSALAENALHTHVIAPAHPPPI